MDQAKRLRELARQRQTAALRLSPSRLSPSALVEPRDGLAAPVPPARVIAVTSGKGGVGKTNLVANLAYALTRRNQRVLVCDADLGLANLDVLLGLTPRFTLQHVLRGEKRLRDVLICGPGGMRVLPASSGIQELTELTDAQRLMLLEAFDQLCERFDFLLLDTGAGISGNVLYFAVAAQEIIIVVTPEPTSITDAYAMMKVLSTRYAERSFKLVVNWVRSSKDAEAVYHRLLRVIGRYLNVRLEYLGYVLRDEKLVQAVKEQCAVLERYPTSSASLCFSSLGERLLEMAPSFEPKGSLQFFWRQLLENVSLSGTEPPPERAVS